MGGGGVEKPRKRKGGGICGRKKSKREVRPLDMGARCSGSGIKQKKFGVGVGCVGN